MLGDETDMPETPDAVATGPREAGAVVGHAKDVSDIEAGLDALQTTVAPTASRWSKAFHAVYPPVLAIAILLAVWQTLVWLEVQPIYNLPGPEQVWEAVTRAAASGKLLSDSTWVSNYVSEPTIILYGPKKPAKKPVNRAKAGKDAAGANANANAGADAEVGADTDAGADATTTTTPAPPQ